MGALERLLSSRKAWQVWSGTWANFASQAAAILSQVTEVLPPAQRNVVTLISVLMGLCFQAAGIASAALTALDDYATKTRELEGGTGRPAVNPRLAGE